MIRLLAKRNIILLLVAIGIAERVAWNAVRSTSGAAGEAMRVATAIGRGDGFADAYLLGQGPTAHLLPITPGFAGLIYQLLGVGSPAAEFVLATWSIGLAMATYLVLYRAFGRLGTPDWARLAGLAAGCMLPTYLGQEAIDFRVWEGGLAALLAALLLDRVLFHARQRPPRRRDLALLAGGSALLFFVNPPLGLGAMACIGLMCLFRISWREYWVPITTALATLALLVTPWAIRNQRVMGAPILLRSNAGLELAIGNYPGELAATDRAAEFMARLNAIHPALGPLPYRRMQAAGGEVAYARRLGDEAKAWMAANPGQVLALALLHVRQTLFPQEWQFTVFGTGGLSGLRAVLSQLVGLFGLIGLLWGLRRDWRGWLYPAVLMGTLIIVSAPFQPVKRYTYLVYPTLLFCAASLAGRAGARFGLSSREQRPVRDDSV